MRWLVLAISLAAAACDGDAWSPRAEHQRATTRRAVALAEHLETLPGVRAANVVLNIPYADPLAPPAPAPASYASVVVELAPGADSTITEDAARAAVEGAIPGASVTVLTAAPVAAEKAVAIGPLRAALAGALVVIIVLALWIVAVYRRAARAQ